MVRVDWSLLVIKSCRHVLGIFAWTWAIFLFSLTFFGGHLEDQLEPPPILRQLIIPILKVLLIAPSFTSAQLNSGEPGQAGHHGSAQAGSAPGSLTRFALNGVEVNVDGQPGFKLSDPPTAQHMDINDDGQYSFSYTAPHTARQERRNQDGSVQGKYSYTDPDGKLVEIEYSADATSGFNAYGENIPPKQVVDVPHPVQDTPEVQEAREKFLDYYNREWNARKALEAKENATAQPESSESVTGSDVIQVNAETSTTSTSVLSDDDEGDDDSEVVNRAEAPAKIGGYNANTIGQNLNPQQNLYSLQFNVGNTPGQSQGQFQQTATVNGGVVPQGPGYFYYVGVGGLPYYVTSLPTRTAVAVSVRASQLGAIPAAAIHDVQRPHYGGGVQRTKQHPAVYVEVGQDYSDLGQTPQNSITPVNFRTSGQTNQNGGFNKQIYPINFPYFGYPVFTY